MAELLETSSEASSYLDAALHLTEAAKVRPGVIRSRLQRVFLVFATSVLIALSVLVVFFANTLETESQRALASFVLIGALMMMLASIGSALVTLWTAYVVQYIRRVATQDEVMESANQLRELLIAIDQLASNQVFVAALATETVKNLRDSAAELSSADLAVAADLSQRPRYRSEIRRAMLTGLRSRAEVAMLLDDWEGQSEQRTQNDLAATK